MSRSQSIKHQELLKPLKSNGNEDWTNWLPCKRNACLATAKKLKTLNNDCAEGHNNHGNHDD